MKRIIHATLIISTVLGLFVTSCKKEDSLQLSGSVEKLTVQEVKTYYQNVVVVKEQSKNNQASNPTVPDFGISNRMEKLGKRVDWQKNQEFISGGSSYLVFSLNEKDRILKTGEKMRRTFLFSKENGQIIFQVCETKTADMTPSVILSQIKAALDNQNLKKTSSIATGSAQLFFYNESYKTNFSCNFENGKFKSTSQAIGFRVSNNSIDAPSANEGPGQTCSWMHTIQWWWGPNGELIDWYVIDSWPVCTGGGGGQEEEQLPDGEGGTGVTDDELCALVSSELGASYFIAGPDPGETIINIANSNNIRFEGPHIFEVGRHQLGVVVTYVFTANTKFVVEKVNGVNMFTAFITAGSLTTSGSSWQYNCESNMLPSTYANISGDGKHINGRYYIHYQINSAYGNCTAKADGNPSKSINLKLVN